MIQQIETKTKNKKNKTNQQQQQQTHTSKKGSHKEMQNEQYVL